MQNLCLELDRSDTVGLTWQPEVERNAQAGRKVLGKGRLAGGASSRM